MSPAVTVIVPTYNRPDLIVASIESALAQTFEDFVVLVGDNGGSPLTEGVVRSFDDPRVRYIRHAESLGAQGNWLELIRLAETPLVASLHDDDTWQPTFLEKTVPPLLEDPTLSIAFVDFHCVDDDGHPLPEHTDWLSRHSGRDVLPAGRFEGDRFDRLRMAVVDNAPQPAYAAVLRRQAVVDTEFPPDIEPIYDLWLDYRVCMRGEGFYYVPERLTNYRVWGGSLTAGGYGLGQDAVFGRIVAENGDAGPLLDEIMAQWADARYARARDAMDDPSRREYSRQQFRLATPGLRGGRWVVAELGGRSALGWDALRAARTGLRAARARFRPGQVTSSGVPETLVRPNERAASLHR